MARAHGLHGEVVVELSTDRTERVAVGAELHLDDGRVLRVERSSPRQDARGRHLVVLAGVSTREAADALRGRTLLAPPIDDPDALWVDELIGAEVHDTAGVARGRVVSVEANPASDLLVTDSGALVPLRFVTERAPGRLVVDAPAGLWDL